MMRLSVLTPEGTVVDSEVTEVYAPGAVGEMGVLPEHITFLGNLDTGEIRYKGAGGAGSLIMSGGVLEVVGNDITILADAAMSPSDIDVGRARQDLAEAERLLGTVDPFSATYAAAEAAAKWAELRIARGGGH
jgi:F-type H+-transporting ATPase subunit epsilon